MGRPARDGANGLHERADRGPLVAAAPRGADRRGRRVLAGGERDPGPRVELLRRRRAQADAPPGRDQFPHLLDRAGHPADDRLVAAGPRHQQPGVPPGHRGAAVDGRCGRDPRQPGYVGQAELATGRQWMIRRQHEHPRLVRERLQRQAGRGDRRPDQRDVGAAVEQPGGRLGQVERPQLHRDPRMSAPERGQQRGPDLPAGGQAQPDRQLTGPRGRRVAGGGDPAFQRRQRLARAVQEGFAGRGQQHAPAGPLQQLDAERLLELADLRAEHLLGHVHATRRGGEARFLRHGDEVPEMPQLDVHGAHIVTAGPAPAQLFSRTRSQPPGPRHPGVRRRN